MVAFLDKTYAELSRRGKVVFVAVTVVGYSAIGVLGVWAWVASIRWIHTW